MQLKLETIKKTSFSTVISNAANKVIWLNTWNTMLKKVNMGRTRFMGLQKQANIFIFIYLLSNGRNGHEGQ